MVEFCNGDENDWFVKCGPLEDYLEDTDALVED